jgi:hypothetical protein
MRTWISCTIIVWISCARAEYEEFLRIARRDHDLRDDVTERLKKIAGSGPFPTLTPQMNVSTAPPASPTPSPTLTATKPAK